MKLQPQSAGDWEEKDVKIGGYVENCAWAPDFLANMADSGSSRIFKPGLPRSRSGANKQNQRKCHVDTDHEHSTDGDGELEPAERLEDVPVQDEKGELNKGNGHLIKPVENVD